MHTFTSLRCVLILLAAGALAACDWAGAPHYTGTGMEMFGPVAMRLHPLSRVVPPPSTAPATAPASPQGTVVEARLELTDQFGDIGKGVGDVILEVDQYDVLSFDHRGHRIGQWTFDLTTADKNRLQWDSITRTYLFKLPTSAGAIGADAKHVVLAATFVLPNSSKLTDQMTLNLK